MSGLPDGGRLLRADEGHQTGAKRRVERMVWGNAQRQTLRLMAESSTRIQSWNINLVSVFGFIGQGNFKLKLKQIFLTWLPLGTKMVFSTGNGKGLKLFLINSR